MHNFVMQFPNVLFLILAIVTGQVKGDYASSCFIVDSQQTGLCMPVKSCKPIYETFLNIRQRGGNITESEKLKLSKLYCGKFKNVVHVCCAKSDIQLNAKGLEILKNTTCGMFSSNRIAHGQPAPLFAFPWLALLKYNYESNPFRCGGSLISDQYVLTAAHCIRGLENDLKEVRLGEYQISTSVDCTNVTRKNQCAPPAEDVGIEEFVIHENYTINGIYSDIALIRLKRPVEFKRHIRPICLPIYDSLQMKEYSSFIIAGWGKTESGTPSDMLMTAYVPKVDRMECENQLRKYNLRQSLNAGHICAGGRGLIDSCRGDSGGPLGYQDFYEDHPRFIQFGIVSIGLRQCGVVNVAGVYTNVVHYLQWITDNLRESSVPPPIEQRFQKEESCNTPNLERGVCVPYKDCPFVNELVRNYGSTSAIPKNDLNFIFQSKCSRDNEPIRLCCVLGTSTYTQQISTTSAPDTMSSADPRFTEDLDYNRDYESQFNAQGLNILNGLSCGNSGGNRVAGGNETELAQYPWMALLRYDSDGDEFKCGGSLITNRYVLTATHCVNKRIYPVIGVRLGEHDLRTNPDCRKLFKKNVCSPAVEDIGVEKIITHPKYNERKRINDIALIKLERDVQFQKHIKPVCLPITKATFQPSSTSFTIAGWGATESATRSNVLLRADVYQQERSVCQNVFSAHAVEINEKHICAGDLKEGRDSCRGDSGGPLVSFTTYSNIKRYTQYGIVASGGIACNLEQGYPGIYTNVLTYLPWITSNIVD